MSAKKLVTVFGATGNQGGSIVSAWARSTDLQSKYSIRAITRDVSKPAAQQLDTDGAEVVAADINDAESLKTAIAGSYAVFAVTNFWETVSKDKEIEQGKNIADVALAAGVKHIVWSSLPHTTNLTEGKLSGIDHFVSKAEVEEYIESNKASFGTLATYYMPAFFMSNFASFINPGPDGKLALASPFPATAKFPVIDIRADTGLYVWGVLEAGSAADGKRIQAVSDWTTGQEIVDTLTEYAGAGEVKFVQVPRDVFQGFLAPKMGDILAEEMTQNMELIGDYSYYGKGTEKEQDASDRFLLEGSHKTSLKKYVESHKPWKFGGQ